MGGALMAIVFVCILVCFALFSVVYLIFASHFFLTTLADSSSGRDEVEYPREFFTDWWWKPILCGWVLFCWLVPSMVVLSPLLAVGPEAYLIVWGAFLWLVFPVSLACSLYAQHWLVLVHRGVLGRMLRHFPALVYVHLVNLAMLAASVWLIGQIVRDGLLWVIPTIVIVPLTLLIYARQWGRFAWLSLNYLPAGAQQARLELPPGERVVQDPWAYDEPAPAEAAPVEATAIQAGAPASSAFQASAPAEEVDAWTDTAPYGIVDDPSLPSFKETPRAPLAPEAPPPPAPVFVEEEDEWATEKKPYEFTEPAPAAARDTKPEADQPVTMTEYFDERDRKEKIAERKAEKAKRKMPPRSKKTPAFHAAMLVGVWRFLAYPSTLIVWATLAALSTLEFILLYMMIVTFPAGLK